MKIGIIGASGLLGKSLCTEALQMGFEIYRIGRLGSSDYSECDALVDLEDIDSEILLPRLDYLIYSAQSSKFRDYPSGIKSVLQINAIAPYLIARRVQELGTKFIYLSSGSVYKNATNEVKETDSILSDGELTIYAGSKIIAEQMLTSLDSPSTIYRPFFIFGPNNKRANLISTIIERIRNQIAIEIDFEEGLFLNPIYCDDAARAILENLDSPLSLINLAGDQIISIKSMATHFGEQLGIEPIFQPRFKASDQKIIGDITLLKSVGFQFKTKLIAGLNLML